MQNRLIYYRDDMQGKFEHPLLICSENLLLLHICNVTYFFAVLHDPD